MHNLTKTILMSATFMVGSLPALAQDAAMGNADATIADNAMGVSDFSTLLAAATAAGMVDALATGGPFTIFAPTNAAFDALPPGTVDSLLLPENIESLTTLLSAHIVPSAYTSDDFNRSFTAGGPVDAADQVLSVDEGMIRLRTLGAGNVLISQGSGTFYVSGSGTAPENANVVMPDIVSSNGVIHGIDTVLSASVN
jgi:uncharacterized surface protein with fasciclin (FAS1) repeats